MKTVIRVRDVMKSDFVLIDGLATVKEGVKSLLENDSHTLFIKRRTEDDEFGIVVLADVAQKVLAENRSPERVNLYEIMTKPVIGVDPEMNIRYCARLFSQFGLSSAPVMKNRDIVGVVSYNDIVLHDLSAEH